MRTTHVYEGPRRPAAQHATVYGKMLTLTLTLTLAGKGEWRPGK